MIRGRTAQAINEKLQNAAGAAAKKDMILILENEAACNTRYGG